MTKVAKEVALSSITLRKYEKPHTTDKRELVKRLCLSLGLLEPGDSRDVIVDIILALMHQIKGKKLLSADEIVEEVKKVRKEYGLTEKGCSNPNIRRQLLRLRVLGVVDKKDSKYRIREFMSLSEIMKEIISKNVQDILDRIDKYAKNIDEIFGISENSQG